MREHVLCEKGELHARTHRDGELPVDLEGILCRAENKTERVSKTEREEGKEQKDARKQETPHFLMAASERRAASSLGRPLASTLSVTNKK